MFENTQKKINPRNTIYKEKWQLEVEEQHELKLLVEKWRRAPSKPSFNSLQPAHSYFFIKLLNRLNLSDG